MRPKLFPLLGSLLLVLPLALECNANTLSRCELRDRLRQNVSAALSERNRNQTDQVLLMLVCQLDKISGLSTSKVHILGERATTAATTTTTVSTTPANQTIIGNQTVNANQTQIAANDTNGGNDLDQEDQALGEDQEEGEPPAEDEENYFAVVDVEEAYEEEGEYLYVAQETNTHFYDWLKLMETLNEEDIQFDEEMLAVANDQVCNADGDSDDHKNDMDWSLGKHGIFQFSDGFFCQTTARCSMNMCNSTCGVFTDENITNDLECLFRTNYWWYLLMTAGPNCYQPDFFNECN
ncbi:uncharacterized protein LOC133151326 [Syngnathus typhle]|uniref:uncharacterized protein LOC133151326 n=1 Tax=Syngnathus typhle TaxID=161592 RepID=UPI002A69B853|nr:uncharacterized protein LOC133151326 [Syngnathus typhle]XP_061130235.1 uncharacterized protein LOC133151326 [Syngnathus typhle]